MSTSPNLNPNTQQRNLPTNIDPIKSRNDQRGIVINMFTWAHTDTHKNTHTHTRELTHTPTHIHSHTHIKKHSTNTFSETALAVKRN